MRKSFLLAFCLVLTLSLGILFPVYSAKKPSGLIQMAILLDTSNSMDGLINQARSKIWNIVNELAKAKKYGRTPILQVSLYEYGNDALSAGEGHLRMIVPLTTDLDKISEELFKLTTYGGQEYCGQVIHSAVSGLQWSKSNSDYKVIVIAGNEPFTQGNTNYAASCKNAIAKGIVVNTIFCGPYQEGVETRWKDGADLTDGTYANIDQDQKMVHIDAPQDKEILKLNQQLNETYLPIGTAGQEKKERQMAEDANAASINAEVMVQRANTKSSSLYKNTGWDLVDRVQEEGFQVLDTIKEDEFPPEMIKMTKAERKKYMESMIKRRETLQKKISELNKQREKYVEAKIKQQSGVDSFDTALIKAIRSQADKKGFAF